MTTIKELADELKVKVSDVKRVLREEYSGIDFSSPDRSLTVDEIRSTRDRIDAFRERRRGRTTEDIVEDLGLALPAPLDELPFVATRGSAGRPRTGRGHRLLLHEEILEFLQDTRGELRRMQAAARRIMREMLVEGRAQRRVKGTRGPNAGWLRAPLGDNGGYHYYLWHALAGMKPVTGLTLERTEVLVRAVRHHDETNAVLDAGARDEYLPVDAREYVEAVESADGAADVLSPEQRRACDHASSVSISKGHPGSGKTTLQLERTRRYDGRLLFVTFGEAQREQARRWLDTYGHGDESALAWTHQELFQHLDPDWRPSPSLAVAAIELQAALAGTPRSLGPWTNRIGALHGELRAHLWGRSLPLLFRGRAAVSDDAAAMQAYVERRAPVLGAQAAQVAANVAAALSPEIRERLFGDLERARRLATRLATGASISPVLDDLDAVLIDEVQDLTLVEQLVCALVARGAARSSGRRAALHVAGDEGQTVRATDFDWGELKNLVNDLIGRPEEFDLPGNVRSPSTITRVINNSWGLYKTMTKGQRPKGYAEAEVDETALGSVLWVELDGASLDALCEIVADTPGAALIYPDTRMPDDVQAAARRAGVVHAAAAPEIKGLDFRVAFVLDVGRRAHDLYKEVPSGADGPIIELENRTAVDAIRVAISRATEVLVFVERALGREERARLATLCSDGAALIEGVVTDVPLAELRARLDVDTADRNELVTEALADFDRTFADAPATGLRIIERARGWLGESNRAGAVKGELRRKVYRAMGIALLHAAIDGDAALFARSNIELNLAKEPDLAGLARDARQILGDDGGTKAMIANLARHAAGDHEPTSRYANLILERRMRAAVERAADHDGRGWDRILDVLDAAGTATTQTSIAALRADLTRRACEWALAQPAGKANDQRAARALEMMDTPAPLSRARLAERRGQWDEAIRWYRNAGALLEALRVSREHGDDEAVSLELAEAAGEPAREVLRRLLGVHRELAELDADELTDRERQRLADRLKAKAPSPRR